MNDLEHDLREVLDEDARRVPTPTSAPEGLRRSVRRRQAVFGSLVGLAGVAIVAGVVAGASLLMPLKNDEQPAGEGPKTTGTLNGITITYPQAWHLIDPDTVGLNGSAMMSESPLPRIVLALAPTEASETFGCPGRSGDTASFLMTIQEEPLAIPSSASTPWPAELEPLAVDASESSCYPDWEFRRAGWTASSRTFEARIGFAPTANQDERDAVSAAFASMTFEPSGEASTSATLTSGTAGGIDWTLIASRENNGLTLTLDAGATGSGAGFLSSPKALHPLVQTLGKGSDRELVVYGAAPTRVTRVEATAADGSIVSADVLDVPSEIDPDLDAYALVLPPGPADLRGYDASGEMVIEGTLGDGGGLITTGASLTDGRHFGYVRSVDTDARTIEFDLAYFLSGEEADQAYQEATGDTGHVPNDHFVVNDNPRLRTLTLAPDARLRLLDWNHCCETFFDGDLSLFAQAIQEQGDVTDGGLIYRGQSSWWITIDRGVVTEIEEQYSP